MAESRKAKQWRLELERRKAFDEWIIELNAIESEMYAKKKVAYNKFVAIADRVDDEISALYKNESEG